MMTKSHRVEVRNGFSYLYTPESRVLQIPSGGAPDGDPPAPAVVPATDPIPWDRIDWAAGPKLTDKNLPPPIQEVFNRSLAKDRREHEQRHGETQTQLRAEAEARKVLELQVADFNAIIEELKNPTQPDPSDDPLRPPPGIAKHPELAAGWVANKQAQLAAEKRADEADKKAAETQKQFEGLKAELDKERESRTKGEQKMLDLRRDREVIGILSSLKVINPKMVLPLFTKDVAYDSDTDSFAYRNADGELVDLETGLQTALPDHFLQSTIANGGSGAHGANGTVRAPTKQQPATDQRTKLSQERDDIRAKAGKGIRLSVADHARMLSIGQELDRLGPVDA